MGRHVLCLKGRGRPAALATQSFLAQPFVGQALRDAGTHHPFTESQEKNQKVKYEKSFSIKK